MERYKESSHAGKCPPVGHKWTSAQVAASAAISAFLVQENLT